MWVPQIDLPYVGFDQVSYIEKILRKFEQDRILLLVKSIFSTWITSDVSLFADKIALTW